MWDKARATGADLLWRINSNAVLPIENPYSDGSFASHVYPGTKARRNRADGIAVRVVEYTPAPGDVDSDAAEHTYRLVTTITDPDAAPASELARLYAQRWEIETAFDELKTHPRGPALVLRSKMPDGVIKEVYGYLCVHYAIRWLMHSAATDYGHDPDRLSFTRSLPAARRTTPRGRILSTRYCSASPLRREGSPNQSYGTLAREFSSDDVSVVWACRKRFVERDERLIGAVSRRPSMEPLPYTSKCSETPFRIAAPDESGQRA